MSANRRAGARGPSQATKLVEIAEGLLFWHTPDREPWVTFESSGHLENWPTRSRAFRRYLAKQFYQREETAPSPQALISALSVLEGQAVHDGIENQVYTRVAGVAGDPSFYIDLCDKDWQAIEISLLGWQVTPSHKVPFIFRRAPGMKTLPVPEPGGSLDELRPFINVKSNDDFVLVVSWLVGAFRPSGPYPVLCLHGEQGSAKTTVARFLRSLIDPNRASLRSCPRDDRDLVISARNGWVIALDNLSQLAPWTSDALCRMSTGGGYVTRALFTDDEEVIFDAQRPILLTGINELATRSDLLDRSIVVTLPPIPEKSRQAEGRPSSRFRGSAPAAVRGAPRRRCECELTVRRT